MKIYQMYGAFTYEEFYEYESSRRDAEARRMNNEA